jgi:hypothetical protein
MVGPRSCKADWGTFEDVSVLDRTQSLQVQQLMPTSFSTFNHGSAYQGLYINPNANFAFCTIEKNACAAWNVLFTKLARNDTRSTFLDWHVIQTSFKNAGPEAAEQIFANPTSTRAVIVRDPLARFASAYFSKCVPMEKHGVCEPTTICLSDTGTKQHPKAVTFESVVNAMLHSDPRSMDGHWKLQSEHCELKTRVSEYSIIGLMKKDTLAADATCILDIAGLSEFNVDGSGQRFWHIPTQSDGDIVHVDPQSEESVLKKLFTPDAARALIAHLKQDYDTFHFQREPDWVKDATGEWYTRLPLPCRPGDSDGFARTNHNMSLLQTNAHEALLEDDIVEMAVRAGFQLQTP